jgi:pilus assembly protein CpaE
MRVLLIDDEVFYYKLISSPLKKAGYEVKYVRTGKKGLEMISSFNPDIMIVDLRLPDITGFEIVLRLRKDPRHNQLPVIFITTQDSLEDKLKAFDLGADDYLVKPFQPEELIARLKILARHGKAMQMVQQKDPDTALPNVASFALHSLRGGVGLSSIALNLALSFQEIWVKRTLLVDTVLAVGQIAILMNEGPSMTWGSLIDIPEDEIDETLINDLISKTSDSFSYIASPRTPLACPAFPGSFWKKVLPMIRMHSDFLVFDTPHQFSEESIAVLTDVDYVLLVLTPDIASLRAAVSAMEGYDSLGINLDQVKLVLNHTANVTGIKTSQLEKVLGRKFDYILPYEPRAVFRAINFGEPFVLTSPELPISMAIEDMAYDLVDDTYKNIPPALPSNAWKRVVARLKAAEKNG